MSIEIIEKPTHKCSVCGCVFSFDTEDFLELSFRKGREEVSLRRFAEIYLCQTAVFCPICGEAHVVKERIERKNL